MIDFDGAQMLWANDRLIDGRIGGRCWTAVVIDRVEDIAHLIEWSKARRADDVAKRVNVDFPVWMVRSLDAQARKRGVTRQALIKMWLADRLEAANAGRSVTTLCIPSRLANLPAEGIA